MRPRLLRPPALRSGSVSDGSGRSFVISAKSGPVWKRRPGEVGRYWMIGTLRSLEEVDAVALGQAHVRLLPARTASGVSTDTADLSHLARRPHLGHAHLEHRLHGVADLDLGGPRMDAEHHLVAELAHQRTLLGDDRSLHHV